ncbi:uncharacterized protein LOC143917933 [Arctopsyche grandis]|uniref:uncharacterized protein LOC143917933 n=1 Tax=Arctopsyche grandis TaxID=121162 RepID=UPI00406D6B95
MLSACMMARGATGAEAETGLGAGTEADSSMLKLTVSELEGTSSLGVSTVLGVCRWCLCGGSLSRILPACCHLVKATFGLQLVSEEEVEEYQYLICDICIEKLKECYSFRCQIEDSQNKFKDILIKADVEEYLNVPDLVIEDTKDNILKCEYPSDDDMSADFDPTSDILIDNALKKAKDRKIIIRSKNSKKNTQSKSVIKRKINAPEPSEPIEITTENAYNVAAHNLLNTENEKSKERRRNNVKLMSEAEFKKYRRLYYRIRYAKAMPFKLEKSALSCDICNETFTTHKNLVSHMANHYPNHICDLCGKAFVLKEQLTGHMRTHSTEKLACKICSKVMKKSSMSRHLRTHSGNNGVYACPSCPQRFVSFSTRINHMAEKHNVDIFRYNCSICSKKFHLANSLTKHVRRCHFQELNVNCPECGKGFFDKKSLKNHMLKHTGEKKYQCEVCRKSYGRKCTIIEHMKIHNNIKQHQCPLCEKAFTQKCTLKGHLKVHDRIQKLNTGEM